jgi:hypothetical protein
MAKDASSVAQRWAANLGSATQKYTDGINSVQTAPGAIAARQSAVWAQNTAASVQKFARNVGAVSLSSWQQAATTKGAPRLASGATAAEPKVLAFMTQFLPFVASAKAGLAPRGTYDQNKARMNSWVDKMHAFKKS